jgi:hypothetical protein
VESPAAIELEAADANGAQTLAAKYRAMAPTRAGENENMRLREITRAGGGSDKQRLCAHGLNRLIFGRVLSSKMSSSGEEEEEEEEEEK